MNSFALDNLRVHGETAMAAMNLAQKRAFIPFLLFLVLPISSFSTQPSVISSSVASDATAYNSQRKVVSDSQGNIYVAYVSGEGDFNQVFVAESKDDGRTWKDIARVSLSSSEGSRVAMAIDSEDNLHVVWTQGLGESAQIFYSGYINKQWTSPLQISTGRGYSGYPSVAVDSRNSLHVVWYGFDGEFYQIFYVTNARGKWSPPQQISTGTPDSVNPSIVVDASDRIHVVWYKRITRNYQIFYRSFDGEWSDPRIISSGPTDSLNVALAVDSKGIVHVVWDKAVDGTSQVFYSKLENGLWTKQMKLSSGDSNAENPTITLDQTGNIFVFWQTSDGGLYLRRFSENWTPQERLPLEGRHIFPSTRWAFYNDPKSPNSLDLIWTDVTEASYALMFSRIEFGSSRFSLSGLIIPSIVVGLLLVALIVVTKRRKQLA